MAFLFIYERQPGFQLLYSADKLPDGNFQFFGHQMDFRVLWYLSLYFVCFFHVCDHFLKVLLTNNCILSYYYIKPHIIQLFFVTHSDIGEMGISSSNEPNKRMSSIQSPLRKKNYSGRSRSREIHSWRFLVLTA